MYLKLKSNYTFIDSKTGITRTSSEEDYPILRIYNLSIRSNDLGFSGEFYINIFWNIESENPFFVEQVQLPNEVIEQYKTISIPEGTTEIDIAQSLQLLIYQYLLSESFSAWELIN